MIVPPHVLRSRDSYPAFSISTNRTGRNRHASVSSRKNAPGGGSAERHDADGRTVREEEHPSPVLQGMRHTGAPTIPSGARRRLAMVAGVVLALAAFLAWRRSAPRAPAAAESQPAPVQAERATRPPAPGAQLAAPAIQLAKRVEVRPARRLAPGAGERTGLYSGKKSGSEGAEMSFWPVNCVCT